MVLVRTIRRAGFRSVLIGATVVTGVSYICYSLFTPQTPHPLIFVTLMQGGLVNSMVMVSLTTLSFSDIPRRRMSHATTLSTMAQQVSLSVGVVTAALMVSATAWFNGADATQIDARDFMPAFVVIGLATLTSLLSFSRLDRDVGNEMRQGRPPSAWYPFS